MARPCNELHGEATRVQNLHGLGDLLLPGLVGIGSTCDIINVNVSREHIKGHWEVVLA